MSRPRKIALTVGGSLLGLLLILIVAAVVVVQTPWFRNAVRQKIVSSVEQATGGKATMGPFEFQWNHLRVTIRDFVVHVLEPANVPPLLSIKLLELYLRPALPSQGFVGISYMLVDTPEADIIVFPDGHTNIPSPKIPSKSNKTGLQTIVDLAIGKFDLRNGTLLFSDRKTAFDATGENLRAQLGYNALASDYKGEIDISPLYLRSGRNPAVPVNVKLPVYATKDQVAVTNAQFTTPESKAVVSATVDHMTAPHFAGHLNAQVALDEVQRAAGLKMALDTRHAPRYVDADITASGDWAPSGHGQIQIQSARVTYGDSNLEAQGTGQNIAFHTTLALGQIGRLLHLSSQPQGSVQAGGNAELRPKGNYQITANVNARGLAFREGSKQISGIGLASTVTASPGRLEFSSLRLAGLGGSFTGSGGIENMAQFHLAGDLHRFDIGEIARVLTGRRLGYDGIVSGPVQVEGNVKHTQDVTARAALRIAPGRRGIPVSGRLNVDYNGRADTVTIASSYLQLPHTRVEIAGTLNRRIELHAVSTDLADDLRPVANVPVTFHNGGAAAVNATVTGRLSAPRIAAQVDLTNFAVEGRPFTRLAAYFNADNSQVAVSNAVLTRGTMQAQFSGSAGLARWKPEPSEPLRVDATVRNADVRDMLALAGQANPPVTGTLAADAHITGTIGSPQGSADLTVLNGTVEGQPFNSLTGRAAMTDRDIAVPALTFIAGPTRIEASANYAHPVNDLKRGFLTMHTASNQVQLAQFQTLVKNRPGLAGTLALNADASANIYPGRTGTEFQLVSLDGQFAARHLQMQGQNLGNFTARAKTAGGDIRYDIDSDFAGSTIRASGQTQIAGNHQTSATLQIANLPVARTLAVAGRSNLPFTGTLAAKANLSGTLQDPHAGATVTVAKGSAYQEPFDRIQATFDYTNQRIDLPQFRVDKSGSYIEAGGSFEHPSGHFQIGQVQFQVRSNDIQLANFQTLESKQPGLAGVVRISAEGSATLRRKEVPLFSKLDASLTARGVSINKKPVGDLTATAQTQGREVAFNLVSDFAHANIRGSGRMRIGDDYPLDARLTFGNVTYAGVSPFLSGAPLPVDASVDGEVTLAGPAAHANNLRGTLRLTKLQAHSAPAATGLQPRVSFELHNEGPVAISLAHSVLTVESARITGPYTTAAVAGSVSLAAPHKLNLRADAKVNLRILEAFSTSAYSSGDVVLTATATGTTAAPAVSGQLQLQNASVNVASAPAGLSDATGTILFNGNQAVIQKIAAVVGGGQVTFAGYIYYGAPQMRFRVQATARHVNVDYPPTVTTEFNARLTVEGTSARSLASGSVTILDVALHQHTDIGSVLTSAATPPSTPIATTGVLAGLRFDVRIRTAPDVQFHTALTQNLQADADLTLRGTLAHPGMIGRIVATSGEVIFFGTKYAIDQGTISFYDPTKIDPIVNIDLQTTVQGIDVTISVSGPMDRMKLSYSSDPPMQFSDLVALLAAGTVPTTDPVLAARTPAQPPQTFEQAGVSTVLGQAVANPVTGRLQRLFGVTRLQINPQITGVQNTPSATLTLQQQITPDLTFIYIQYVTQANSELFQIQWTIDPRWSVIAQRDINGMFDLDFFYKKRFW